MVHDGVGGGHGRGRVERGATREELEEEQPRAEDVAARIEGLVRGLLRGEVAGRATDRVAVSGRRRREAPEVEHANAPPAAVESLEEHVVRREVAVDEPAACAASSASRTGRMHREGALEVEPPAALEDRAERAPAEERHDDEGPRARVDPGRDDGDEPRVAHRPRPLDERQRGGIAEELQRDRVPGARMSGAVDVAAAPASEALFEPIAADEPPAGGAPRTHTPEDEPTALPFRGGGFILRAMQGDSNSTDAPGNDQASVDESTAAADPLAEAQAEAARMKDAWIRSAADFDNFRKRTRERARGRAPGGREDLLRALLPVFDNLERAIQSAQRERGREGGGRGLSMVQRQFVEALGREGIARIPTVGQPFDPSMHEAIQQVETDDHPPGTVLAEVQPGYTQGDRLLRAAMVVVAKRQEAQATAPQGRVEAAN